MTAMMRYVRLFCSALPRSSRIRIPVHMYYDLFIYTCGRMDRYLSTSLAGMNNELIAFWNEMEIKIPHLQNNH